MTDDTLKVPRTNRESNVRKRYDTARTMSSNQKKNQFYDFIHIRHNWKVESEIFYEELQLLVDKIRNQDIFIMIQRFNEALKQKGELLKIFAHNMRI